MGSAKFCCALCLQRWCPSDLFSRTENRLKCPAGESFACHFPCSLLYAQQSWQEHWAKRWHQVGHLPALREKRCWWLGVDVGRRRGLLAAPGVAAVPSGTLAWPAHLDTPTATQESQCSTSPRPAWGITLIRNFNWKKNLSILYICRLKAEIKITSGLHNLLVLSMYYSWLLKWPSYLWQKPSFSFQNLLFGPNFYLIACWKYIVFITTTKKICCLWNIRDFHILSSISVYYSII